ncbi:T7SS effector LXG polymorphic toxin [Bacillus sp. FSL W7-1360]
MRVLNVKEFRAYLDHAIEKNSKPLDTLHSLEEAMNKMGTLGAKWENMAPELEKEDPEFVQMMREVQNVSKRIATPRGLMGASEAYIDALKQVRDELSKIEENHDFFCEAFLEDFVLGGIKKIEEAADSGESEEQLKVMVAQLGQFVDIELFDMADLPQAMSNLRGKVNEKLRDLVQFDRKGVELMAPVKEKLKQLQKVMY